MSIKILMKIVISILINLFVFNKSINAQTTLKPFSDEEINDYELLISKAKKLRKNSELDSARVVIEKLFLIANNLNIDTLKGRVFLEKGNLEHRLSNYKKADSLLNLATPLLKEAPQHLIDVYFKKFGINFLSEDLDSSIYYLDKARFYIGNDTMSSKMMRYFNKRASYFIHKHEYLKGTVCKKK